MRMPAIIPLVRQPDKQRGTPQVELEVEDPASRIAYGWHMGLLQPLVDLFAGHGYGAVLVMLLICGMGVPVPEDITLVAGGIIAGLGHANVHVMCVVGLLGVLAGDAMMFLAGRHFGPRLLSTRWLGWLLAPPRYARVQRLFARHGDRLMFGARFLPGLRSAIYLSAGMSRRVSFPRFLLFDGAAALISVPIWIYLGYFGAANHDKLLDWITRGKYGVLLAVVLVAAFIGFYIWSRARRLGRLQKMRARRRKARSPKH